MSKECLDPYKIASAGTRRFLDEGGNRHKKWIPGQAHKRIGEIGNEIANQIPEEVKGAVKAAVPVIAGVGAALVSTEVAQAAEGSQVLDKANLNLRYTTLLLSTSVMTYFGYQDRVSNMPPKGQSRSGYAIRGTGYILEASAFGFLLADTPFTAADGSENPINYIKAVAQFIALNSLGKDIFKKSYLLNKSNR